METETGPDTETATSESAPAWTESSSTPEETFGSSAGAANAAGAGSYTGGSSRAPDGSPPGPVAPSTTTTTTTELPPPPPPPPPREPPIPSPRPPPGRNKTRVRISSEAAENTALVIGIIAGAMIAIILLILIILKFKNRADGSYKVDESKNYRAQTAQGAASVGAVGGGGGVPVGAGAGVGTGLLGCNGQPQLQPGLLHHQLHPQQAAHPALQHMNGSVKNGTGLDKVAPGKPAKKQNVKDVKEWYV